MKTDNLSIEGECLHTNNQQLIDQIRSLTDELYGKLKEIQELKYTITEQKVSFMNEMNKNNEIVNLLKERINHLQESGLMYDKKEGDILLHEKNSNIYDEPEYIKMNHELRLQVEELVEKLRNELPHVQNLETTNKNIEARLISNIDLLDSVSNENQTLVTENMRLSQKFQSASQMIKELVSQKRDLCQQIQTLLYTDKKDSSNYESNNNVEYSNSQDVISSQLVSFTNIEELQQQNLRLITAMRNLTEKFENNSEENSKDDGEKKKLKSEIYNLRNKIQVLLTENDSFKLLMDGNKLITQHRENEYKMKELNDQLILQENNYKQRIADITETLNEKEITLSKNNNKLNYLLKEKEILSNELKELKKINEQLREEHRHMKDLCNGFEDDLVGLRSDLLSYKTQCQQNSNTVDCLDDEVTRLQKDKELLEKEIRLYQQEKHDFEVKLLSIRKESPSNESVIIERLKKKLEEKEKIFVEKLQEYKNLYCQKEKNWETTIEILNKQIIWLQAQTPLQSIPLSDQDMKTTPKNEIEDIYTEDIGQVSDSLDFNEKVNSEDNGLNKEIGHDANITIIKLQQEKNLYENKITALNLEVSLLKSQLELYCKEENLSVIKKSNDVDQLTDDKFINIMSELKELDLMKNTIKSLKEELDQITGEKAELETENQRLNQTNQSSTSELQKYKSELLVATKNVALHKEESNRWKNMAEQLKNSEQIQTLSDELAKYKAELEAKTKENIELEDKFNRLKRQAHEKLNASKVASAQLSSEVDELTTKQAELQLIIARYKEMEIEYNGKQHEFTELQTQLNETTERLKISELKLQENHRAYTNLEQKLKDMQQEYEHKEKEAIEKVTAELKSKYENATNENNISSVNLKKMRDEWERETQVRIEQAKEGLKKHIRLPTEEKIKKIIEKRKSQLENEFDQRVEEKARVLKLSDELKKPVEDIVKELEQKIKERIEEDFNSNLKKKAFEEGKHQASMRTTLLERKISKLEAQLEGKQPPDNKVSLGSQQRKSISGLSKIDINKPFQLASPKLDLASKSLSTLSAVGSPFEFKTPMNMLLDSEQPVESSDDTESKKKPLEDKLDDLPLKKLKPLE
ncbi:hypothetical protein RI543_004648 [Arxiozyma heterogenica]|uniref:NUA/TPR/MLP1-2-like domain-containing protein n=1 Tax=Arxiozyma heterogenica TaxID=278026 RepID=A0AAN7WGW6_9SACH|nr:hypothetical protein RI543_004648 [Kazachstania heterogenica]